MSRINDSVNNTTVKLLTGATPYHCGPAIVIQMIACCCNNALIDLEALLGRLYLPTDEALLPDPDTSPVN